MYQIFNKLRKSESGVAFIEFAIAFPVLMSMLLATIELTRYVLAHQKIDKMTVAIGDIITQNAALCKDELDQIVNRGVPRMLEPFDVAGNTQLYFIFVEVVDPPGPAPKRANIYDLHSYHWSHSVASQIAAGGVNSQPIGAAGFDFVADDGFTLIVESYFDYSLIVNSQFANDYLGLSPGDIYGYAILKPRYGSQLEIVPSSDPAC